MLRQVTMFQALGVTIDSKRDFDNNLQKILEKS